MGHNELERLIIIGASGHGRVCADIAELVGYKEIVFLDDNPMVKSCGGYPVLGTREYVSKIEGNLFVAIGNCAARQSILKRLPKDRIVTLIHPQAIISRTAKVGLGSVVVGGAVINSNAVIGEGCIINTLSSVDHDCNIGDFVHVAVGCHLAGTVEVGNYCFLGAGSTVINNIRICGYTTIGAGAVVVNDITTPGVYVGVPARKLEK